MVKFRARKTQLVTHFSLLIDLKCLVVSKYKNNNKKHTTSTILAVVCTSIIVNCYSFARYTYGMNGVYPLKRISQGLSYSITIKTPHHPRSVRKQQWSPAAIQMINISNEKYFNVEWGLSYLAKTKIRIQKESKHK